MAKKVTFKIDNLKIDVPEAAFTIETLTTDNGIPKLELPVISAHVRIDLNENTAITFQDIQNLFDLSTALKIDSIGRMARSAGAEENLLRLLKIMLATPARGWPGLQDFGVRDALAELPFKVHLRQETVKRVNASLSELGIDWVEVKMIEI